MFRLTVGRRLAVIVALTVGAMSLITWLVFRSLSVESSDMMLDSLQGMASPIEASIDNELWAARSYL
ncbi:MAG: hypothetical protein ACR2P0_00095, partial [Acidimicrobiales bacterium]